MDCMKKELIERLKNFIILYIKNKEKIEKSISNSSYYIKEIIRL